MRDQCNWLMGLADALFPLVPRACRLLTGGGADVKVRELEEGDWDYGTPNTSRYFGLMCAGAAGSKRCIDWILRNKHTRNNKKECIAVLRGLCLGGHLDMAKELVEGGDTPWCGCELLRWPAGDRDVIDDLREMRCIKSQPYNLLYDACKGGNLDVVKWVMSAFRGLGTEPWEFPMPFRAAVRWGHLDVVKWLSSYTCAVPACSEILANCVKGCYLAHFVASQSLEVVKFCTELFRGSEPPEHGQIMLEQLIECCPGEFQVEESCQWIKEQFSETHHPGLRSIFDSKNAKGSKWLINSFSLKPTQEDLDCACIEIADQELTEWFITNFSDSIGPVEPHTLISACRNKKDSVLVLESLLSKMRAPLKAEAITRCLIMCLRQSNTSVAEWLEKKFHVMDHVNSVPRLTDEIFSDVHLLMSEATGGIQWLLSNCTVTNISEKSVVDAIHHFIQQKAPGALLILLNIFDVSILSEKDKTDVVNAIASRGSVSQAKQIVSLVRFSSENVAQGLSHNDVNSGKVVKWFIQQFHLNENQVKRNDNRLLHRLIEYNKTSCSEWLIRRFHVTLKEFETMLDVHGIDSSTSLVGTWKMLLRVYPEMTLSFVKQHLWDFVIASHLHIKASTKRLGLTDADLDADEDSSLWTHVWIM
ncbi:hypothetical protein Pelo_13030 [Pelomyxa schiedti]|nr:hypothetical protein Pelo_13030 [Pelomyxa schiedti]